MAKKAAKKVKAASDHGSNPEAGQMPAALKSKTALAKEYIQANPKSGNKEVLTALVATVPNLTYADVANARSMLTKKSSKAGGTSAAKKAGRKPAGEIRPVGGANLMEMVKRAAEFSRAAGGIEQAIALLQTLQSIRAM